MLAGGLEADAALEARLVDDCAEGDAAAWRRLHRRYYPIAGAFLRKLGVRDRDSRTLRRKVPQLQYLPRFRREAALSTWLYRLCITQARVVRRRTRVTDALLRVLALAAPHELVSSGSLAEDAARRRIEVALAALPAGEREVFVLYEMEGVPGKRIADIVKCRSDRVASPHYARQAFRRAID